MVETNRQTDRPLLETKEVVKHYPITGGVFLRQIASVKAVDGVTLNILPGETLGLVENPAVASLRWAGLFCVWRSLLPAIFSFRERVFLVMNRSR